jgi:hypothetical protein
VTEADVVPGLPVENAAVDLTKKLDAAKAAEWESLLDALRAHQARERYEDHVSLLEALITVHRLTEKGERASKILAGLDWKAWLEFADTVYLPLAAQTAEVDRLAGSLPTPINISAITSRSRIVLDTVRAAYATFYVEPAKGLPSWIANRKFAAGTCRPAINSDILEHFVKPLFSDVSLQQVYLIVFDGMSVANWAMLRDRFIMAHGRELFRFYQGPPEQRAFTFLPSITHICRRAIFAGTIPSTFYTWTYADNESELLSKCLSSLGCLPPDFDKSKHYFCFNEKDADPEKLNRDLRTLIDRPAKFKAIVLNLQDRLLDKSGISSIQEIMLAYVREVALPHLRRISAQKDTAIVITSDHGFASYDMQYIIDDLQFKKPGKEGHIHNRCLEYLGSRRTARGPARLKRLDSSGPFGLPASWRATDVVTGPDSYDWPPATGPNPARKRGQDHGGLTPEETVVPVVTLETR